MNIAKRSLLEPLIARAISGRGDFGVPNPLPVDKSRFPKLLLLDFNHWVRLAKASMGLVFDLPAASALKAIRNARRSGRLILAFTGDTLGEAALPADEGRRRRIARFIVDESENTGVINAQTVFEADLVSAAGALVRGDRPAQSLRPTLLYRGVHATLSGSSRSPTTGVPKYDPMFALVLAQPEISVEAIVTMMSSAQRDWTYERESALKIRLEGLRPEWAKLAPDQRRDSECRNGFEIGSGAEAYSAALERAGIEANGFRTWLAGEGRPAELVAAVPHIRVMLDLLLFREKNAQQPYRSNDTRDLRFLQLAIPYANVVVVEKSWGHVTQACGVAEAFGTTVLLRLEALPGALIDERCL